MNQIQGGLRTLGIVRDRNSRMLSGDPLLMGLMTRHLWRPRAAWHGPIGLAATDVAQERPNRHLPANFQRYFSGSQLGRWFVTTVRTGLGSRPFARVGPGVVCVACAVALHLCVQHVPARRWGLTPGLTGTAPATRSEENNRLNDDGGWLDHNQGCVRSRIQG